MLLVLGMMVKSIEVAMKINFVVVSLIVGIAGVCLGDAQSQNQQEAKPEMQDSAIRWQFDTHG